MSYGWWVWFAVELCLYTVQGQVAQSCPPRNELEPCICTPKKNGLDILCEFTDMNHISKAMAILKGKPSIIVFYLKLRRNNLPKLQSFVFLGIDIRHLTIHNSSLSVIEESSLSSMGRGLVQLDLSLNHLKNIPSPDFRNLQRLLILNMNHNLISGLHSKAFEGLDTLEILTLYGNKITSVEENAFKGLEKKLKRLNLGANSLTRVPQQAFSVLDNLRKLELQENKIDSVLEGDFDGLKNLDSLGLAHNLIREVPARVFTPLTFLNALELDGNQIYRIDVDAFVGLEENLQYLRLGDNNLPEIPSEALRRLHRLRHLDLRSNNITVVPEDAFAGFGDSIRFLQLQRNHIKILPAMIFDNLNSLESLNLQNNKLVHIPEEVMEPIVDTLKVLDIMDNPLICDCQLQWFSFWLKNLKDRDEEMMQKKRTLCTMLPDHQELHVQNLPMEKMNCLSKTAGRGGGSSMSCFTPIGLLTLVCSIPTIAIF